MPTLHNKANKTAPSDAIYIGRGSKWGNPFIIGDEGMTRNEVIKEYEAWLMNNQELLEQLTELTGKDLVCWCAPEACHGDVLMRLANYQVCHRLYLDGIPCFADVEDRVDRKHSSSYFCEEHDDMFWDMVPDSWLPIEDMHDFFDDPFLAIERVREANQDNKEGKTMMCSICDGEKYMTVDSNICKACDEFYNNETKEFPDTEKVTKVAFTGHRPPKIGGYGKNETADWIYEEIKRVLDKLEEKLGTKIHGNTGGALGVDTIAARACAMTERDFSVYVPFKGQESRWPKESQDTYHKMLGHAKEIHYLAESAGTNKQAAYLLNKRNEVMVDFSDWVIAVWNGEEKGGTYNCVKYAMNAGRPMILINPDTRETVIRA